MFSLPSFAAIFFLIHQISTSTALFRKTADFQKNVGDSQSCPCFPPEPHSKYIVLPQSNPTSGSIFSNDPGVVLFINTFTQAVYCSDILSEVFDLSQATPLEYSKFIYKYNLDLYKRRGFENADAIAEFAARGVTNFDVLTMPFMVRILHNTAGNFLFVERILNVECAESLALAYAETIEKDARVNLTADPTSKFKILADSFFKFILSVDKNSKIVFPVTTYVFGNEWFVACVNYKYVNQ